MPTTAVGVSSGPSVSVSRLTGATAATPATRPAGQCGRRARTRSPPPAAGLPQRRTRPGPQGTVLRCSAWPRPSVLTATASESSSTGPACGLRPACHIPNIVAGQCLRSTYRSANLVTNGSSRNDTTAPASTPTVGATTSSGSMPRPPPPPESGEAYCRNWNQASTARPTSARSTLARCAKASRLGRDRDGELLHIGPGAAHRRSDHGDQADQRGGHRDRPEPRTQSWRQADRGVGEDRQPASRRQHGSCQGWADAGPPGG